MKLFMEQVNIGARLLSCLLGSAFFCTAIIIQASADSTTHAANDDTVQRLIETIQNEKNSDEWRLMAVQSLAVPEVGDARNAIPVLNELLVNAKDADLRLAAIKALGRIGLADDERALAWLIFAREENAGSLRALTEHQMRRKRNFAHVWNFETTWSIEEGKTYPFLQKHAVQASAGGGTGTADDPYLVATAEQLDNVRNSLGSDKHFRQVRDIDLAGYGDLQQGWDPIRGGAIGSYDGGGYRILNLRINRPNMDNVGLFGNLGWGDEDSPGKLTRIALENVRVIGRNRVGALAGHIGHAQSSASAKSVVENCYATGTVSGRDIVGGLVGQIWQAKVKDCYVAVEVNAEEGGSASPFVDRLWWHSKARSCFYNADRAGIENIATAALHVLHHHKPDLDTASAMLDMLRADDAFVRSRAANLLSSLNPDTETMPKSLMLALQDDRFDVRRRTRRLADTYGKDIKKQLVATLSGAYQEANLDPAERVRLTRAAGELALEPSITFLIKVFDDPSADVRLQAVKSLQWMEIPYIGRYTPFGMSDSHWWKAVHPEWRANVLPVLQKLAANDLDERVRESAQAAFDRIGGTGEIPPVPPMLAEERTLIPELPETTRSFLKDAYAQVAIRRQKEIENYARKVNWPFGGGSCSKTASAQLYLYRNLEGANRLLMEYTDLAPEGSQAGGLGAPFWAAVYGLYNSRSPHLPGRLSVELEELFEQRMMMFVEWKSKEAFDDYINDIWKLAGTENHHLTMGPVTWYLYLGYLARNPEYADRRLHDGRTVAEWSELWDAYWREWLKERALKGLWIETGSPAYQKYSYPGIFALYIGAKDPVVRHCAKMFLDLSLIDENQTSYGYIRGGGKSRAGKSYGGGGLRHILPPLYGEERPNDAWHLGLHTPLISGYVPPPEAILLKNKYQYPEEPVVIANRRLGEIDENNEIKPDSAIIGYTYKTRHYMLGSYLRPPAIRTSALFAQEMTSGLVFASGGGVYPQPVHRGGGRFINPYYSFQHENVLILQKNEGAYNTGNIRIHVKSKTRKVERDGWVFVNDGDAYAAIRVLEGGYHWSDKGQHVVPDQELAPMLIQGGDVDEFKSFENFMAAVQANTASWEGERVEYAGPKQHRIEFFSRPLAKLPRVNGREYDFSPQQVYSSPFLNSEAGTSRVTVTVGSLQTVYDFDKAEIIRKVRTD